MAETVSGPSGPSVALRYASAVASVVVCLTLRRLLDPLIHQSETPFLLFFAPVMLSAWYGGLGPGLLATGLAAGAIDYDFLPPPGSLKIVSLGQGARLALFVAEASLIAYLTQRARWATERTRASLHRAETELAQRERAEAALGEAHRTAQEANRLKDDFLATLSHELRTPLSAILGWARVLRSRQSDRETTDRALESIERNVRAQTKLIDDLLDISHIISGRLRLEVRPVELAPLIVDAVETIRPAAEAKAIRLDTVLDPRAGPISGDPERLQQIVWNLVSNAVKFTPTGGSIQVRLERRDPAVEVVVSDTGPGIAPEFLPHVFEHFRPADSSTARHQGGLGLGLAIARHLTELHGGAIRADSPGVGRGATFTVSFPVRVTGEGPARVVPGQSEKIRPSAVGVLAGVTVLLVDDEADARETLRVVLDQRGAEVRTVSGGTQAMDLLGRWTPDVLVSDIGMPGEDGYSLIRRVRDLAPDRGGRVPAVALTAYVKPEDRMRALAAGFQTHVPKPVDPDELALVVARLAGLGRPASP